MLNRRELLQRDPAVPWRKLISELRGAGWGTAEMCFVLNVTRGTLWHWENDEEPNPGYEDGRALLKLHALVCPPSPLRILFASSRQMIGFATT
jgi:hypothetical protein